jgi:hypothetical protein
MLVGIALLLKNWTILYWSFPIMIFRLGEGKFYEEVEVQ